MKIEKVLLVGKLPDDMDFVSDSQDVREIKAALPLAAEYDSFFVKIGEGEYLEVWGLNGIVPLKEKLAYRIF